MTTGNIDMSTIRIEDYLHVQGVRLPDPNMPHWKLKPLEENNLKLIHNYLLLQAEEEEKRLEEERWAAIPEWKRPLLREREKKRRELEEAQRKIFEADKLEREKFENLPSWKQEILLKKRETAKNSVTKAQESEKIHNEDATIILPAAVATGDKNSADGDDSTANTTEGEQKENNGINFEEIDSADDLNIPEADEVINGYDITKEEKLEQQLEEQEEEREEYRREEEERMMGN